MKKFGLLIPLVFIFVFTMLMPRFFSGEISPTTMILASGALLGVMFLLRPKKGAKKSAETIAAEVLKDFGHDAFADNEELRKKYYAILGDIGGNMPKSAVSKLSKLAPMCSGEKERYAVAMATAYAWKKQSDFKNAVREYNKALIIHPTADLAYVIGDCHQRLGALDKARDSYDFALELDPGNAKYPSSIATAYVGDGDYDTAMEYAAEALDIDENYSQALATMSICYGLKNDNLMHKHYLKLAVANGYNENKIQETVRALKKRDRR